MRIKTADKKEDGLVFVETFRYGKQIWIWCKIRKWHVCRICKERFESGATMYRPATNKDNRMERYCTDCVNAASSASGVEQ